MVIIWPIPIPLLGLTIWASSEPKIPLPKDLYFWEPTATVQILGWGYFIYLEDFGGLKFACQNLIHQHNNNIWWSFQRPKQPNHTLNDRFCDHSRGTVFFSQSSTRIFAPFWDSIFGPFFSLNFQRFYLL